MYPCLLRRRRTLLTAFIYLVKQCNVSLQDVGLPYALHTFQPCLPRIGVPGRQIVQDTKADDHPWYDATSKDKQLLTIEWFYKQKGMKEILLLERFLQRKDPNQKKIWTSPCKKLSKCGSFHWSSEWLAWFSRTNDETCDICARLSESIEQLWLKRTEFGKLV